MRAFVLNLLELVLVNWLSMVNASKENIVECSAPKDLTLSRCFYVPSGGFDVGVCRKRDGGYVGGTIKGSRYTRMNFSSNGAVISEETRSFDSKESIPLDHSSVADIIAVMKAILRVYPKIK